ncbi:hypothetical protein SAMN05444274_1204 [Mariniphaga anaerophila]|uniref:Uncharacterized protein n=1 Tax=Mariniphaga anaerophila TaxID=1484053 RepID=A0A1M5GE48_9BACT|nr:hypothetical protein [Mariniphaga anaerophila]SHG01994.1 hypothetical protein SAMN05444274_1204 [Mariniphaga anaerophila]
MKPKILIILATILTIGAQCANGQEIFDTLRKYRVERIKKENPKSFDSEAKETINLGISELEKVFSIIKKKYKTDFTATDSLFIISGYDMETGFSNGRIWDKKGNEFRFERKFELKNFKIENETLSVLKVTPKYLATTEFPILTDFDPLIELIEKKDTSEIFSLQSENAVDSAWSYNISIIERNDGKYKIFEFPLDDFWIK